MAAAEPRNRTAVSTGSVRSRRGDAGEACFDGLLHFLVQFPGLLAGGRDGLADDYPDRTRLFDEATPRPKPAGVMRQRHHALTRRDREQRAAHSELARIAGDHPGTFRKNDDPQTVGEARLALFDHLI